MLKKRTKEERAVLVAAQDRDTRVAAEKDHAERVATDPIFARVVDRQKIANARRDVVRIESRLKRRMLQHGGLTTELDRITRTLDAVESREPHRVANLSASRDDVTLARQDLRRDIEKDEAALKAARESLAALELGI